jgi:hypothetical protein
MDLNIKVINIDDESVHLISKDCFCCVFWFEPSSNNLIEDFFKIKNILELFKIRLSESRNKKNKENTFSLFLKSGGTLVAAINKKKECLGIAAFGRYHLFPRLKVFSVYPPDPSSYFLACIFVTKEYRDLGIEQKLLISVQKELLRKKKYSIESIGKRINEDSDLEDQDNCPIIPIKFLINNGFYIKKNDVQFPLLRIDLRSIQKALSEEEDLLEKYILRKKLIKTFLYKKT